MAVSFFILLLLHPLRAKMGGDVGLYDQIATDVLDAKLPYRDRPFEYPPYVIPLFLIPRIFGQERFLIAFPIFALLADFIIKLTLFVSGTRQSKGLRGLAPLLLYCVAVPSLASWYLQRYDVWPALICLAGILWFCRGSYALSGAAIAIGIGLKVYPVVFVLPMFVFAARQGKSKSFLLGLLAGLSPLVVLGFFLPWWRFAQFQAARGLQVESIYASILWFGKLMGLYHLTWEQTKAWKEVHGAIAAAVLPWTRVVWSAGMIISVAVATAAITRRGKLSAPYLCELLLVPLLSFVVFNQVFSPQFTIWLLPLAALASLGQNSWTSTAILLATMVTPIFCPSLFHDYGRTGLGEFETGVLLLRNLLLVVVWVSLVSRSMERVTSSEVSGRSVRIDIDGPMV
jgi:hypothetical protein